VTLARVFLALSALTFAGFGVAFLAAPAGMGGLVEVWADSPTARADVRATYGGFELGFAAFLFACLARREWTAAGLLASTLALAGFAAARSGSALLDGPVSPLTFVLVAAEAAGAVMSLAGWRLAARGEPGDRR
jgi:hypothetical protein